MTTIQSALQTLTRDFAAFDAALKGDPAKTDGLISVDDLRVVADNVGGKYSADQQQAAQFLLDNPAQLNFVDVASGVGNVDGMISQDGLTNATGVVNGGNEQSLNALLDTAASQRGEGRGDGIHGSRDIHALLMDPGLNPDLRALLQGRAEGEIRAKLGQLIDPGTYAQPANAHTQNMRTLAEATRLLADTVQGMDPKAAAALVQKLWPDIQAQIRKNDGGGFSDADFASKNVLEQMGRIAAVVQRSGNTELFNQLVNDARGLRGLSLVTPGISGSAQMTLDDEASMQGLPLYLELAKQAAANGQSEPYALVQNILNYHKSETARLTQDYNHHIKDLAWHISNQGQQATPEQLQTAINNYVNAQSPEWREKYHALQDQLAQHGEQLLAAVTDLRTSLPQADALRLVESMLGSKEAQFAVQTALDQNPALAGDPNVVADRDWMAKAAESGGSGFKATLQVAQALGTTFLRQTVQHAITNGLDPNGTPDPQRLLAELEGLKNQPGLARSLGLSDPRALDNAITQLQNLNTEIANGNLRTPAELQAFLEQHIRPELNGAEAFGLDRPGGQVFRTLASTVGALSFAKATQTAFTHPDFVSIVNASAQGVEVAQQISQMGESAGLFNANGRVAGFGNNPGIAKLVGSVGVALDAVGALQAFGDDDTLQGALQTVSALGGVVAIFGASSWAGPAGAIVAGVASAISLGVSLFRQSEEANKYENDTAQRFLRDAGYNDATAGILRDNSGEGISPLPLLAKYAHDRGLSPQQTREFLNALGTERNGEHLWKLRDNIHHVLDGVDGDLGKLGNSDWQVRREFDTRVELWASQHGIRLKDR